MKIKTTRPHFARSFVESLEGRMLLSVASSEAVYPAKAKTVLPSVAFSVSKKSIELGQKDVFNVRVSYPKRLGTLDGAIEFFDGSNPIETTNAALSVSLTSKNRASYTFAPGNVALYLGRQSFAAEFVSANTVPNGLSKAKIVNIKLPKFKPFPDGLETATVVAGHGKSLKAGNTATVLYTGFLASTGQIFDYATAGHGAGSSPTFSFTVEASPEQVISGFDQGVVGMKDGETRVLAIPSELGYGPSGSGSIPANADLVFLIQLLSFTT